MPGDSFVPLHTHTEVSMLDGAARLDDLFAECARMGMPALAMTDHGNVFGAYDFHRQATEAGIKPIVGMEAYLAPGSRFVVYTEFARQEFLRVSGAGQASGEQFPVGGSGAPQMGDERGPSLRCVTGLEYGQCACDSSVIGDMYAEAFVEVVRDSPKALKIEGAKEDHEVKPHPCDPALVARAPAYPRG